MTIVGRATLGAMGLLCGVLVFLIGRPCNGVLPRDPNNGALLYYQAFMLCPKADSATETCIETVANGGILDPQINSYLKRCSIAITYAQKAGHASSCDWGIWYSLGLRYSLPHLDSARRLSRVLQADARVLAAEGDIRGAVERCLTIRRLSRDIGIETIHSYAAAMELETRAQNSICQILGSTPVDTGNIVWLKEQLAAVPPVSRSVARSLEMDLELTLQNLREEKSIQLVRQQIAEAKSDADAKGIESLSDQELMSQVRTTYMGFLDSAVHIIDANLPYQKAYTELRGLADALQKTGGNPVARALGVVLGDAVVGSYGVQIKNTARLNAFCVAIEIYNEKARTGQLPEKLPAGMPKDPYSGENFTYAVTNDGFMLCTGVRPVDGRELLELQYRVCGGGAH